MLGRRVVPALIDAGHAVVGVARSAEKRAVLESAGAETASCDIFDYDAVAAAAQGCDAFANLATHIPVDGYWKRSAWKLNDRIRTEVSAIAARVAGEQDMQVLLQESISMTYPNRNAEWIDESVSCKWTFNTKSAATAEEHALGTARAGLRAVVLRFGLFNSPDGGHAAMYARAARYGIALSFGKPDAYMSSIAIDDAGTAVSAGIEAPTGIYNVVDDRPMTKREAAAALATALDHDKLRRFPGRLALLLPDSQIGALTRSQRVSNTKFKDATGWSPRG